MTKLVYLDCPTGIAGDMCLGALVDAGVPLNYLQEKLATLGNAGEYELRAELVHRNGQQATKVHVDLTDEQHHHHHDHAPTRHLPEIEQMILGANLPTRASEWSVAVFRRLAEAEGAVHGIAAAKVHFHEVGATDAIVDIVGTCLGLDWLEVERIYCSALPTGGGTIRAAHGRLPVPPPAVLKLFEMRQVPIYSNGIEREMVTPTGAAIATTLATDFGSPPAMTLHKVGLGAGSKDLPLPNILRLWVGEDSVTKGTHEHSQSSIPQSPSPLEEISVLETQIDDLSPQAIAYVYDLLLEAGALDVFSSAIAMKKSRLGILLTVICHPQHLAVCEDILFRETTTLGIRRLTQQRAILQRQIQPVQTQYGTIRVKIAWRENPQIPTNIQPEYEDCAALAKAHNIPWREMHDLALETWKRKL